MGLTLGLDHQGGANYNNIPTNSCMDYQNEPWLWPNAHDYAQLNDMAMYGHSDQYDSYFVDPGGSEEEGGGGCNAPPGKGCNKAGVGRSNAENGWGISLGRRGNHEKFLRIDPDGTRVLTDVHWVDGHESHNGQDGH